MKRRILALGILFVFVLTSTAFTFKFDSLNTTLKIGLKNMTAPSIGVTLEGNYYTSNDLFSSGTSLNLSVSNGKIMYNGAGYDELVFTPLEDDNLIKLAIGAKRYSYRGTMDFKISGNDILPINIIDIETYLKGVVAFEMSNSYPLEALKAQAVAARNYALVNRGKHRSQGYDLCDTTDCQVYKGYNSTYTNVIKAVDDTRGKVMVYGDELVSAFYTASDGGYTEASGNIWSKQLPYLISKQDTMENEDWPYGNQVLKTSEIDARLKSKNYIKSTDKFGKIDLTSILRNASGRISSIDILYFNLNGQEVRKSFIKEGPRTFLSLPSASYNVAYDSTTDSYTFSGKGYGHGVGMSQIGAKYRALAGQTYDQILAFYYDGTSIVTMNDEIKNDQTDISNTTGQVINVDPSKTTDPSGGIPNSNTGDSDTFPSGNNIDNTIPKDTTGDNKQSPSSNNTGVNKTTTDSSINVIPKPNDSQPADKGSDSKTVTPASIFPRVLKKGMSGGDVKRLQDGLKKLKYLNVAATTNYFGSTTEKSLKGFQKSKGIKATGIADRKTLDALAKIIVKEPADIAVVYLKDGNKAVVIRK